MKIAWWVVARSGFLCRTNRRMRATVHCLLRTDYPHVRQHGLRIQSIDGDFMSIQLAPRNPQRSAPVTWS
jgi:hypothetical protein